MTVRPPELTPSIIHACQAGDAEALRALVDHYADRVHRYCYGLVGPEAADLAQETFLRVLRSIGRFDPAGPAVLGTWIITIARRLCRDHLRKSGNAAIAAEDLHPLLPLAAASPEAHLSSGETQRLVQAAMRALPAEQVSVLLLRILEGLSYEEIASVEQVPVGTVRSRLARVRAALADKLAAELDLDGTSSSNEETIDAAH